MEFSQGGLVSCSTIFNEILKSSYVVGVWSFVLLCELISQCLR